MDGCVIACLHIRMGVWMGVYGHVCVRMYMFVRLRTWLFVNVSIFVCVILCVRAYVRQGGIDIYAYCCTLELYCTAVALLDI